MFGKSSARSQSILFQDLAHILLNLFTFALFPDWKNFWASRLENIPVQMTNTNSITYALFIGWPGNFFPATTLCFFFFFGLFFSFSFSFCDERMERELLNGVGYNSSTISTKSDSIDAMPNSNGSEKEDKIKLCNSVSFSYYDIQLFNINFEPLYL